MSKHISDLWEEDSWTVCGTSMTGEVNGAADADMALSHKWNESQ